MQQPVRVAAAAAASTELSSADAEPGSDAAGKLITSRRVISFGKY